MDSRNFNSYSHDSDVTVKYMGHFIGRFLFLNLNKTKLVRDIIEIFYSFERPIDAISCVI